MTKDIIKLASQVDLKKTAFTVGGLLLLIIMVLYIRKKIKESKEESKNEKYLNAVNDSIDSSSLTFSSVEYQTMADSLYAYLSDTRAGYAGVDEDGVYDVMSRLRTNDDVNKIITVFGSKEIRKRWTTKSSTYTLPGAISALMSQKERDKVNKCLEKNGITFRF
ncbi:MAG: hypothetical protein IKY27_08580 [Bacteroidales bacterium]|nr:hypothetical protein [Bacteroidales bacterium]